LRARAHRAARVTIAPTDLSTILAGGLNTACSTF
jgi:hypothetical protein